MGWSKCASCYFEQPERARGHEIGASRTGRGIGMWIIARPARFGRPGYGMSAPSRTRTYNLRIKSPQLCQLSYRGGDTAKTWAVIRREPRLIVSVLSGYGSIGVVGQFSTPMGPGCLPDEADPGAIPQVLQHL